MSMAPNQDKIRLAAQWVKEAKAILITAGAGMGVDSGLPDFRGEEGLWKAYPALGQAKMRFQDIANPAGFIEHPDLAWGFYGHRLDQYRSIQPHAGFGILKRWAENAPNGYWVFTSNVDGQFQKAGFNYARVHECHGSIHQLQCEDPCRHEIWDAAGFEPEVDENTCRLLNHAPVCPFCGGMARPNILMFNDYSWVEQPAMFSRMRLDNWVRNQSEILVIELGAGTAIPTARNFGERWANRFIRINPQQAGVRGGEKNVGLQGNALDILQEIDDTSVIT